MDEERRCNRGSRNGRSRRKKEKNQRWGEVDTVKEEAVPERFKS